MGLIISQHIAVVRIKPGDKTAVGGLLLVETPSPMSNPMADGVYARKLSV